MVDFQQIKQKFYNLFVLGNNYDGCLLTGDTSDLMQFEACRLLENPDFRQKLLNFRYLNLGLKNAALIDGI